MRAGRLPDPSLTFGVSNYPITGPGAFSFRSDTMTMRTAGVMQAIPSHAAREADHIRVSVQGGTVTLSGHIGSAAERRAAKGAAWSAPGVTEVIDHLQIAP